MEARFSAPIQTGPGAHPASYTMGTGSFPGVKSGRSVTLTPHRFLVLWSRKSRAIAQLPLWTVRPVQSLSACTRVHFIFTYTPTPPMDRTACTEPQCLYKGALYLYLLCFQVEKLLFGSSCTMPRKCIALRITLLICIKEQDVKGLVNTSKTVITVG